MNNTTYNSFYLFDLIFPSSLVQSRSIFIALVNFPCGSASIFIWKWQNKKITRHLISKGALIMEPS